MVFIKPEALNSSLPPPLAQKSLTWKEQDGSVTEISSDGSASPCSSADTSGELLGRSIILYTGALIIRMGFRVYSGLAPTNSIAPIIPGHALSFGIVLGLRSDWCTREVPRSIL